LIYIDTNVIVSYVDEKDPNHDKVVAMFKRLDRERVVSQLTLLELSSIYARAELERPISLAISSIKRFNASMIETDLNIIMKESLRRVPTLRLKTLDLLHISVAKLMGAKSLATLDKEIARRADMIKKSTALPGWSLRG
jgi:predicted nucleic acid-binding protein